MHQVRAPNVDAECSLEPQPLVEIASFLELHQVSIP
ncbi:hypothetical protein LINGRAHAP2_LOCUS30927 [Linum grandiflorum]